MYGCNQPTITNNAFVHLKGIKELDMGCCRQHTITDATFIHLAGIHTLNITGCRQPGFTDNAFVHLNGIHTLIINYCSTLSSRALDPIREHLKVIHKCGCMFF
jgi:hypothetical protein